MKRTTWTAAVLVVLLGLLPASARLGAQEPASSVARVSLIHGDVSTQRGDSGDWVATTVNAPLVIGDTVYASSDSRAEVSLDYANAVRLDQQAQIKIANLTSANVQLQLSQGQVDYVVLRHSAADIEIDTPNVAIHPFAEGTYRVEVNPSNSGTILIVRRGQATVSTAQGSTTVATEQMITIEGADDPQYQTATAPSPDDWDRWNENRDRQVLQAESWQHANAYYVGANDLDRYGHWVDVPGYGWVWSPYVSDPYWAPYRVGRWVWEPYYGWTWVSYEPWGWAPYHYGRWFFYAGSWCWWPGPPAPTFRPVYAPAYVSFFGFGFGGRNWSFGFGFGYRSVGWLPVGPSDPYYPWHAYRNTYNTVNVTNITKVTNVTNVTNIQNGQNGAVVAPLAAARQPVMSNVQTVTTNVHVRQALTSVSTEQFVKGSVPRQPQAVEVAELRQAQVIRGTVPAVPTHESLSPMNRPARVVAVPRQAASTQRFFAANAPPPGPRPFTERAAQIRQMVQQRTPPPATQAGVSGSGRAETARPVETPPSERPGWRRFGASGPTNNGVRGNPGGATSATGGGNRSVEERRIPATPGAEPRSKANGRVETERRPDTSHPVETARRTPSGQPARPTREGWHRFGEKQSSSHESSNKNHGSEKSSRGGERQK